MTLDWDLVFVIGLISGVLSVPALLSAYSEGRAPRVAILLAVISAGLIAVAVLQRPPGTYSIGQIPDVLTRVGAGLFR